MSVAYPDLRVEAEAAGLRVRLRVENVGEETWRAADGFGFGWQVFDPETHALIAEGERAALAADLPPGGAVQAEMWVALPPEPGRYRVFVSPVDSRAGWGYAREWPFVLIDAEVQDGRPAVLASRVITERLLRWELFLRSVRRGIQFPLRSLWRNRALIFSMVRRDILARYKGSFAGLFWTVLNPLLLMGTYYFVFGVVLQTRFQNDPTSSGFVLYFLAGMLPWLAFSEAAGRAPFVILEHRNFVKKLVFPLETLPVNMALAGLVTELFALGIFVLVLLWERGGVPATILWLPVLLIPQLLFTLGVAWFLAALGVYVRDLGQVSGFLLTLWFFLTPICYPQESLPPLALKILAKNPLYVLVRGYRAIFLETHAPMFNPVFKLWLLAMVTFFLGHAWFYRLRKNFADVI